MHIIVLESLQRGFFGVRISIVTMNPVYEIPLAAAITLLICLIVLYPVSKISVLKKIIGVSGKKSSNCHRDSNFPELLKYRRFSITTEK